VVVVVVVMVLETERDFELEYALLRVGGIEIYIRGTLDSPPPFSLPASPLLAYEMPNLFQSLHQDSLPQRAWHSSCSNHRDIVGCHDEGVNVQNKYFYSHYN
jgi:hypothetical protein